MSKTDFVDGLLTKVLVGGVIDLADGERTTFGGLESILLFKPKLFFVESFDFEVGDFGFSLEGGDFNGAFVKVLSVVPLLGDKIFCEPDEIQRINSTYKAHLSRQIHHATKFTTKTYAPRFH